MTAVQVGPMVTLREFLRVDQAVNPAPQTN